MFKILLKSYMHSKKHAAWVNASCNGVLQLDVFSISFCWYFIRKDKNKKKRNQANCYKKTKYNRARKAQIEQKFIKLRFYNISRTIRLRSYRLNALYDCYDCACNRHYKQAHKRNQKFL